ncbi:IS5 family transposase, partial [Neisseria bergeri]
IQTAGSKQRQAIEIDEEGQVSGQTTPSKDKDARWTKKNGLYKLGYKQHTRTDEEGYIGKLYITPANTHECNHLSPLLEGIAEGTTVYADKGYDSKENRQHLEEHQLSDGIMCKAHRNRPLTEAQTKRNRNLSKTCYVVEQSFGMLHHKFRYARSAYFGLIKVSAQSNLKAMCLNLLKADNWLSAPAAA